MFPQMLTLMQSAGAWVAIVVIMLFAIIFLAIFAQFASLWLQCVMTNSGIRLWDLITMKFRKVNPTVIVRCMIMAVQSGLTKNYPITRVKLEAHYLAQGNVPNVHAEEGCIEYGATVDLADAGPIQTKAGDDTFIVIEKWESLDHLKAHAAVPKILHLW